MNKFGEFILQLRKENGLTQAELANKIGITNKAVSKWETGDAFPETSLLLPIAKIFNVSVDELLRGKKDCNNINNNDNEILEEKLIPYTKADILGISFSIGLILIAVLLLIILSLNNISYGINVPIFIGLISIGVFILIFIFMQKELKNIKLEKDTFVKGKNIIIRFTLGIFFTIISVIPLISLLSYGYSPSIYLTTFFIILIIGILLIVYNGIQLNQFNIKYNISNNTNKSKKIANLENTISSIIMLIATAIFLMLGFIFDKWHPGWIVFPIGGIICGIASTLIKGFYNKN